MNTEKALETIIRMMDRKEAGKPKGMAKAIKVLRKKKPKEKEEEEEEEPVVDNLLEESEKE